MSRLHLAPFFSLMLIVAPGCAGESSDDEEDVDTTRGALLASNSLGPNSLGPNSLGPNSLGPNSLGPNSLGPNSLGPNSLGPNSLGPNGMAALTADTLVGQQNRQLVQYAVSCAFTPSQSFTFSWTDSAGVVHDEVYSGLLGIAPGWATAPLTDETDQRMISACLAARTNWYGVTVLVSLRSKLAPLRTQVGSAELAAYPVVEGAFFGNLFSSSPYIYACYEASNVGLARAAQRDCAAGHLDANGQPVQCGIIQILGPCSDWCEHLDPHERWYSDCTDPKHSACDPSNAVIAVALP